jgi:hypothetical protein
VSTDPTVTFSQAVVPSTVSFTVQDSGGNTVAGAVQPILENPQSRSPEFPS